MGAIEPTNLTVANLNLDHVTYMSQIALGEAGGGSELKHLKLLVLLPNPELSETILLISSKYIFVDSYGHNVEDFHNYCYDIFTFVYK